MNDPTVTAVSDERLREFAFGPRHTAPLFAEMESMARELLRARSALSWADSIIATRHGTDAEALKALRSALADVGGWRCFHCGEVCETEESAVDHFGSNQAATPACRLAPDLAGIVKLVRDQESELAKYRAEDSESHREFYRIGADHAVALRRAEETGYARGLEDAKKHPETLGLAAGTGKQPRPAASVRPKLFIEGVSDQESPAAHTAQVSEAQIHAMCNYLQGHCHKCPAEIDTAYGRGEQGCHAIALETLNKALAISRLAEQGSGAKPEASEAERE